MVNMPPAKLVPDVKVNTPLEKVRGATFPLGQSQVNPLAVFDNVSP
jgi:hypothetical protein